MEINKLFMRLYAFLSQIAPFHDIELEKLYAFCRFFLRKLPRRRSGEHYKLCDEVALEYYRLQKMSDGKIPLQKGSGAAIDPMKEAGTRRDKEEFAHLSEIIKIINERFDTDFTEADKLFFDQIEEELVLDEKLGTQAKSNTMDNFKFGFDDVFLVKLVDRMDQNQDLFNKIMEDKEFGGLVKDYLLKRVYKRLSAHE